MMALFGGGECSKSCKAKVEMVFDAIADGVVLVDQHGIISFCNQAAERMFGFRAHEAIGEDVCNFIFADDFRRRFDTELEKFKQGGASQEGELIETRALRKNGEMFPIELSLSFMRDEDGWCAIGIFRDITECKRAEEKLRDSYAFLDGIINAIGDPIFVKDSNYRFVAVNEALCQFVGLSRDEVLGRCDYDIFPFEQASVFRNFDNYVLANNKESVNEMELPDSTGFVHTVVTKKELFKDKSGNQFIVGVTRVVTDYKKLTMKIANAQKLESIGQLAAGVAHEYNNIMTAIMGYAHLMDMDLQRLPQLECGDRWSVYVKGILNASARAVDHTQKLVSFSRCKSGTCIQSVDVSSIAAEVIDMVRLTMKDTEINLKIEATRMIDGDPSEIYRAVLNLVINGCLATMDVPGKRKVIVSTEDVDIKESHGLARPGEYVLVTVQDTGCGIDERIREKIFEPFFTTRPTGQGTGLGLFMTCGVVKAHKGFIDFVSEVGKGTSFFVYLPAGTMKSLSSVQLSRPELESRQQAIRNVLVIDDDESVLSFTSCALEALGYSPIIAKGGGEGISIFSRMHEEILFVMLDMLMPGMDGLKTVGILREIDPDVKVLLATGYADDDSVDGIIMKGGEVIRKPFSIEELQCGIDKLVLK